MTHLPEIVIESGLLDHLDTKYLTKRCAIICDDIVAALYAEMLMRQLGGEILLCTFPYGESSKTRRTKELIEDQMLDRGFGRESSIIGLGGGVATDIAGFVASTYCRGIPYVSIPTTLLGMCDAGLGGKTGVNVPQGKNMIGTFYQPKAIYIDPSTLKSLPLKEKRCGAAEMIKHGMIADSNYFAYLQNNHKRLFQEPYLTEAISESVRIKKEIVLADEREVTGRRSTLNFGHTVAHALEKLSHYTLSHGEAVAIGILAESKMSGMDTGAIKDLLLAFELPIQPSFSVSPEQLYDAMKHDKKAVNGVPYFVKLEAIGLAGACTPVEKQMLETLW